MYLIEVLVFSIMVYDFTDTFDERLDIEETIPDLAINIEEALQTGKIQDTIDTSTYTKETDVTKVGHYLADAIDIAMAQMRLGQSLSQAATASTSQEEI